MEFKDVVAISGMPGLYESMSVRPDGMIVRAIGSNKKQYVSQRIHTFSPIDKIGIYIEDGDTLDLLDVMLSIQEQEKDSLVLPKPNSKADVLKKFMRTILPTYDDDKVYVSDIKKLIKWYNLLSPTGVIQPKPEKEEVGEDATDATSENEATTNEPTDK